MLRAYSYMVDGRWHHARETNRAPIPYNDPAFAAALGIYQGDWRRRAELESRIIADEPATGIAAKMALTAATVELYFEWFFYARPKSSSRADIMLSAIGRVDDKVPFKRHQVSAFWKWTALNFGLDRLEQLLAAVDRKTLRSDGIDAYLRPEAKLELPFKVMIAMKRLPRLRAEWAVMRRARVLDRLRAQLPAGETELPAPLTSLRESGLDDHTELGAELLDHAEMDEYEYDEDDSEDGDFDNAFKVDTGHDSLCDAMNIGESDRSFTEPFRGAGTTVTLNEAWWGDLEDENLDDDEFWDDE